MSNCRNCDCADKSQCTKKRGFHVEAMERECSDGEYWRRETENFLLYVFTFSLGAGPVTGLIIPELSSTRTRAKTMAFSLCVHWVSNFFIGLFFLDMVEKFGLPLVYASFGTVSLLAAAFTNYCVPETQGRSLEVIQMLLNPDLE